MIPLSLYIHFPWCVSKCPYCDFNSYALRGRLDESGYVGALERDLAEQAAAVSGRSLISIFMGGGTPSLFSPHSIERVLAFVRRHFALEPDAEITMEANPGTVEHGRFSEYRAAGINRVSLGAQTFDARRLKILGRIHSDDETRRAAAELHAAGLDNFNLDLMYALPEQNAADALRDVEEALALEPAHLSHYELTLEPGTVFAARPPRLPEDAVTVDGLNMCRERMAAAGFTQYEVSAYARERRRCVHNLNYWMFGDYLGVGAGAHGKLTIGPGISVVRSTHQRDPRRYIAAESPLQRRVVPKRDLPFEFMLNALRLQDGADLRTFAELTGVEGSEIEDKVGQCIQRGLLERRSSSLRATPLGFRFLNDVLLAFLPETQEMSGGFGLSTPA